MAGMSHTPKILADIFMTSLQFSDSQIYTITLINTQEVKNRISMHVSAATDK